MAKMDRDAKANGREDGSGWTADDGAPAAPGAPPADVAQYIADLTGELAAMARSSKLDTLAHLLDIVHLEAGTTSR